MNNDVVAQLEALQAPPEVIDAARAKVTPHDPHFHVWEENWSVLNLFLELQEQWRVQVGMAGVVYFGLDNTAVLSTMIMQLIPRKAWPAMLKGLRVMQSAALPLLNDRS